jgi:phosphatidylserine/phosphatidylglycerophosphate/cardiolipin synthase-like enzyme
VSSTCCSPNCHAYVQQDFGCVHLQPHGRPHLPRAAVIVCGGRQGARAIQRREAHLQIRVIADNDQSESQGSDIAQLRSAGVPVRTDKSPAHMHHKFAVLDSVCLLNGSFNWTRGASNDNNENIMAIGAPKLVAAYAKEFERLWAKFE